MAKIFPREVEIKSGETLRIRKAEETDVAAILKYVNNVARETDFLTFGEGEFEKTKKEEEAIIREYRKAQNRIFIIAELGDAIVGILHVNASNKPRLKHIGDFGITVTKNHWGKGIGTCLIQSMLDWAKASGIIRKINLTVQVNNEAARALYEKFGFEKEGLIKRDSCIGGKFYDSYAMGILIDSSS